MWKTSVTCTTICSQIDRGIPFSVYPSSAPHPGRYISLEVCGTQNEHEAVRELIIDTMITNEKSFSKYVGGDLGNYLSQHTLRPRPWGSDVEIFAAATLLQTTIDVFTPTSPDCRKWLSHPPLFSIPGVLPSDERIYLSNLCSRFDRVIRV